MAWTYVNPTTGDRDKVRFLVGDTNDNDQLVTDEEIEWALETENVYNAAATVALSIALKFARQADKTVDDLSIKYSQKSKNYMDLARELRTRANKRSFARPYLGGTSKAQKDSDAEDTDLVQPFFKKGQFDYDPTTDNEEDC
jgi:hypothetical protein